MVPMSRLPMKVVAAFDKYKDALDASSACRIVADTLHSHRPDVQIHQMPITDGGEGFVSILTEGVGGVLEKIASKDPLGRDMESTIGWVPAGKLPSTVRSLLGLQGEQVLAVIEMATASGLLFLKEAERNPWKTSTYGTGLLMAEAVRRKASAILLGVGGSATNDLGCGCIQALGVEFRQAGQVMREGINPDAFASVDSIQATASSGLPPVFIACDVRNPLLGPSGATHTFGPQKGLQDIDTMEQAVKTMATQLQEAFPGGLSTEAEGVGAAGGIAFGLSRVAPVQLLPGFDFVASWMNMETTLQDADWLLTGEGKMDVSSLQGKGPMQVARMASKSGSSIALFPGAISGSVQRDMRKEWGNIIIEPLSQPDWPLALALKKTEERLREVTKKWANENLLKGGDE